MQKFKKMALTLGVAALICGTSPLALAKGDGHGHHGKSHHPMKRMLSQLELSENQQIEIDALLTQFKQDNPRPDRDAMKAKKAERKEQMLSMLNDPVFNADAVREKVTAAQEQRVDGMVAKMQLQHAIYQQLNEEQRAQYAKMLSRMGKHRKGRAQ